MRVPARHTADRLPEQSEAAADRVRQSLIVFEERLEQKYNFDPGQPRHPRGVPFGGRWVHVPGVPPLELDPESLAVAIDQGGQALDRFLFEHRQVDILKRGDAWEVFDAKRTGYLRTPSARTFDQISPDGRVAVSNKTLDLQRETYLRTDKKAILTTLRGYINAAASYTPVHPLTKEALKAPERRLNVLLRFGDSVEGQALQIAAAEQYAKDMGVILKVEYAY